MKELKDIGFEAEDFEFSRLLKGEADAKAGRYKPLNKVIANLRKKQLLKENHSFDKGGD